MNAYVSLDTVKGRLGISDVVDDTRLRQIIEAKSRDVEGPIATGGTGRVFYSYTATRYFSGTGRKWVLLPDDLIAVTTLKEDSTGSGSFGVTWTSSDYLLAPYDHDPTGAAGLRTTKPFTRIEVALSGTRGVFARGQRNFEIVGKWGFSESAKASGSDLDGALNSSSTSVTVDSGADFDVLQTILVESEQMYITDISGTTLTVDRGINGTTAASHDDDTAVSIIQYPAGVREAVLIESVREWQMGEAHYSSSLGDPDTGNVQLMGGGFRNVTKDHLAEYRAAPVLG